jgi:hypothetical protein
MISIDHALEWNAAAVHRMVGSEPENPWRADAIVEELVGPIEYFAGLGEGRLEPNGDGWRVSVNRSLAWPRQHFAIAHELAHWFYKKHGIPHDEAMADALAAAIIAPRRAALALFNAVGLDLREFAETFEVTWTCAALRFGEVTWTPIATFSRQLVRVRGEDFGWPDERTLRRALRGELPPGLRRLAIDDERGRVALVGELALAA